MRDVACGHGVPQLVPLPHAEHEARERVPAEARDRDETGGHAVIPQRVVRRIARVPEICVLVHVVRDAISERDPVGHVWHERVVPAISDDDPSDDRAA